MTPVSIYASLSHYWSHLQPVAEALRSSTTAILGGVEAPPGRPWGSPLRRNRHGTLWLVASGADAQRLTPAPVVYLEHGAGQSYHGDARARRSGSYAGGDGLDHVVLFLCPGESVAERWRARYPRTPAVVAGSPKMDRLHRELVDDPGSDQDGADQAQDEDDRQDGHEEEHTPDRTRGPVVALAFHWPNSLCPESQWALPHYRSHLPALRDAVADAGGELIGHGHPRAWRQMRREWARLGIRAVEHLDDVFDHADVLVVDNSSIAPEFASLGRPIVWLSAPWYRRGVDHGGRFWDWTDGMPHVEEPDHLVPTVLDVMADPARWDDARARMVASTYAYTDGRAAERAAEAILEVCTTWEARSPHA